MVKAIVCFAVSNLLMALTSASQDIPWHRFQIEPDENLPFAYGVASGDPYNDSVLIWTRAEIPANDSISWSVWLPAGSFESNVTWGTASTSAEQDYTLTVHVDGLMPNTVYFYAFEYSGKRSRIGRTRTAPSPTDEGFTLMKVAVMSCSRVWNGYFNAYREIAVRDDIHVVLHVGDWLYPDFEQPHCERVPTGLCRDNCRGKEIEVEGIPPQPDCSRLTDFRHHHKVLNTDIDVRAIRAHHPMIIMPDNHDIGTKTLNFTGADSIKAWSEWVPNRATSSPEPDGTIAFHRHIRYGKLFDLIVLDTRNVGLKEEPKSYLGATQELWLNTTILPDSKDATWRLIATSQVFTPWLISDYNIVIATPVIIIVLVLFLPLLACIGIRLKRSNQPTKIETKIEDDTIRLSHYKMSDDEENPRSALKQTGEKLKKIRDKCSICCLSNICMGIVISLIIALLIALPIVISQLSKQFKPDELTGEHRLQDKSKGKAWDSNPISRINFLEMLSANEVSGNNVWLTGDMHMALTTEVYDTVPGLAPLERKPSETTRYGVEFLPTGVTSPSVDEHVERRLGINMFTDMVKPFASFGFWWILMNGNEHFKYFDTTRHGYGIITFDAEKAVGEIRFYDKSIAGDPSYVGYKGAVLKDQNKWS